MLLVLDDDNKQHISFLIDGNPTVCKDFCSLSTEFLLKGINYKVFNTAAQKLGVEPFIVKNAVLGIMHILTESARAMLNESEFHDSLLSLGFSVDSQQFLVQWYTENKQHLRNILNKAVLDSPRYKNLDWRLDVQLASRYLRHQVTPMFQLELTLEDNTQPEEDDRIQHIRLQTDPTNLLHMTKVLEQALQEAKSQHARRIARNLS